MKITVCGKSLDVPEGTTALGVLEEENIEISANVLIRSREVKELPPRAPGLPPQRMTLSVNDRLVLRKDLKSTVLKEGDEVECLYFEAGG